MAKLIFIGEKFGGRVYELTTGKFKVGRGDDNALAIRDPSVSQTHCEILVYGTEVIVRDLGSSNGTFVNGERLHCQQRQLKGGQIVKFGSVEARLQSDAPPATETATDETAIYSHVRHLREHQPEPKPPAAFPTILDSGLPAEMADHTLLLPRPSGAQATSVLAGAAEARKSGKPRNRITLALIVALLVVGLAIIVFIILGK
jgi:pSer/pThr/pTyr-binding forkhead associated (FHA) protein